MRFFIKLSKKKKEAEQESISEKKALQKLLPTLFQSAVALDFDGKPSEMIGKTRFGGIPDVPENFIWPYFKTATYEDTEEKMRPLAFLAQFDLSELAKYDKDKLLPKMGVLSFFYELESQCWGFDPKDKGCARVFWFEDVTALHPARMPKDLSEEFRLEPSSIQMKTVQTLPEWEDFIMIDDTITKDFEIYYEERDALLSNTADSHLFGYSDLVQGNMTVQCELVTKGYYMGSDWSKIPKEERDAAEKTFSDWQLLFQLDSVGDLMFGDCGKIYFYIRKEDLAKRRFDRVWLILQCG